MRHFHFVSRTPQAALTNISGALQALLVLLELSGQVRDLVATIEAKKGAAS